MKQILKQILAFLNIAVTRNQKYDAYTRKIIRTTLKPGSCCIDIGCHTGEILDLMIAGAPGGRMFGFEPIPELYSFLKNKYKDRPGVEIFPVALYDSKGTTSFQHVLDAPAYSGIRKRKYASDKVDIREITVQTGLLDDILPADAAIDLMKIDVEGAEFNVLKGSVNTICRCKPVIIFEFGLGAAEFYGSQPGDLYRFMNHECRMKLSTLSGYLSNASSLSESSFKSLYENGTEYYFVAHA
jgi:FkbM family methyltransferase